MTARVRRISSALLWPVRLRAAVQNFFYHGVQDGDEEITMTQSSPCADVCLCRSADGPVAGRPTAIPIRFSRRLSSSFPAASLNDVAWLIAEDQKGKCHDD